MVDVITSAIIHRSPAAVAAFSSNPENAPLWYKNIKSVKWKTEPILKVGSQIAFMAEFMGRKLEYTYEVVQMNAGSFVMQTSEGPFPMQTIYEWTALPDGGTEMRLRNRGTPSGFSKLMAPFMTWMMKRANNKDLQKLKSIMEKMP